MEGRGHVKNGADGKKASRKVRLPDPRGVETVIESTRLDMEGASSTTRIQGCV